MRIEDELIIAAPVDTVWQLTTDVESWPTVTPTMTRVERLDHGPFDVGSRARVKQPRQSAAIWTVTELRQRECFAWATRRLGLRMVGTHRLEGVGDGCRNTLSIDITGFGARLFTRLFGGAIRTSIATENAGFQRAAERALATSTGSAHPT
jgi:uncharacterized membrane protein